MTFNFLRGPISTIKELFVTTIIIIIVGILTILYSINVMRTYTLNKIPAQNELALMLITISNAETIEQKIREWPDLINHLEYSYPDLTSWKKQTRLAHALSMAKPGITQSDYEFFKKLGAKYR